MARSCTVCAHEARRDIDDAGRAGIPSLDVLLELSQRTGLTRAVIERHVRRCDPVAEAPSPARRRKGAKVASEDAPPDSGPRAAPEARLGASPAEEPEAAPLPPPRELAAPDEELRRRAQLLTRQLEHMIDTRAEARHIASVAGALARVDGLILAREKGLRPIHEHPAFEGLVMDLVAAVVEELGPNVPAGFEDGAAARFEARQAERAEADTRPRAREAA